MLGLLSAACASVAFANLLFGLAIITKLGSIPIWRVYLLLPTVAALATMTVILAAQRFPALSGGGYPFVAAGSLLAAAVNGLSDDRIRIVVFGAAAGVTLGGLALAATAAPGLERLAIGAGLAAGVVANRAIVQLLPEHRPPYLRFVIAGGVAVLAAVLVARRRAALAAAGNDAGNDAGRPFGATLAVAVAGGAVIAGLLLLSSDPPTSRMRYGLMGLAGIVALLMAWMAYRRAGAQGARWPLLGFALAGGLALICFPLQRPLTTTMAVIATGGAVLGAALAFAAPRLMPWEAFGVVAMAAGLLQTHAIEGPLLGIVNDRLVLGSGLVLGGAGFALGAGLVLAASLPSGATGMAIGFVTLLLTAQAVGPVADESMIPDDPNLSIAAAAAALLIAGLFVVPPRPTDAPDTGPPMRREPDPGLAAAQTIGHQATGAP